MGASLKQLENDTRRCLKQVHDNVHGDIHIDPVSELLFVFFVVFVLKSCFECL